MSEDQKQSQLFESVSALVDNQASPLEMQRILAHAEKNTGVRARWHRYHLARAVMRGEAKNLMTADISDKVREAIANLDIDFQTDLVGDSSASDKLTSTSVVAEKMARLPVWFAPVGRVAIAASVATAVVLGAQQIPFNSADSNNGLAGTETAARNSAYQTADINNVANLGRLNVQNVSSASFATPVNDARWQAAYDAQQRRQQWEEEQIRQAINRLMLEHAQQSSLDQSDGLMPFIRVSDSAFINEVSQ